jgi:ABC-type glutathione transport system ATPase component
VRLPDDEPFLRRFPHQISGGQRQRVALAAALAHRPDLLVLDEPTSALDPATAAALLADISALRDAGGPAVLLVAHDLGQVAAVADEVLVLDAGRVAERGPVAELFARPVSAAARALVAATHHGILPEPRVGDGAGKPALAVRGLHARRGSAAVLRDIDLWVEPGGCLSVVGPSGGGKTTLLRCLTGLHPHWSGTLALAGREVAHRVRGRTGTELRAVQLVPQDPHDSLNPRHRVERIIGRPLARHRPDLDPGAVREEVGRLLERVGLAREHADRHPGHLSGGQRQRVALARALAVEPDVLLCDEVTSALDAPTAHTVLGLLAELRRDLGVALVVVTHDLTVPARLGGHLAVLSDGRVREHGPVGRVLHAPEHPVTRELIAAVPNPPRPAPEAATVPDPT